MYRLNMIFVVHEPMGFDQKLTPIPSFLSRSYIVNVLIIAKIAMHGTFCFAIENVADPLVFKKKLCFKDVFLSKTEELNDHFNRKQMGPML